MSQFMESDLPQVVILQDQLKMLRHIIRPDWLPEIIHIDMIDNWTLQRAAISINDTYEKISSPNEEYVKLIEALVLWDHVYFIDNSP